MDNTKHLLQSLSKNEKLGSPILKDLSDWGYVIVSDVTNHQTPVGQREYLFIRFTEKGEQLLNEMTYGLGDTVRIVGQPEIYRITQASSDGPRYLLQLGNDGANIRWKFEHEIELVAKAPEPNRGSGFVPARGIMG